MVNQSDKVRDVINKMGGNVQMEIDAKLTGVKVEKNKAREFGHVMKKF